MASISLYRCSGKVSGPMRFRVSDGRGVCLYWSAFCPGRDETVVERYRGMVAQAYETMRKGGMPLTSSVLREVIERRLAHKAMAVPVAQRYRTFIREAYEGGFIGTARYRQCCCIARRLERWLMMTGRKGLAADGFDSAVLLEYRKFLFDEYLYVKKFPQYYRSGVRVPVRRRKNSSVVMELRALRAFFAELEDLEEIHRSPFRMLSREKRKSIMHVMYDAPVFLRKTEFETLRKAVIPRHLEWVRDVFVFNCCVVTISVKTTQAFRR